ncbi:alpha-N-acetylgalactosaminidase isoform X1 [Maniola jurtina]|uniref:alpha-N-acetylgalactosaminidase isoform X1 n=2 Tax=Maniola jurtina TaxID=191418 RepID=UPI001E689311|nr:alpha-N-acetylgalactosaminidase isoform X1 [Maniola jurtina]
MMQIFLVFAGVVSCAVALDNGLALTPPMGWLTWQRFRCITDCKQYPNECISEALIKRTADIMLSEGYLDAGYNYVGIDDCWLEKKRDENDRLVPDRERFPNGMKAIADYLHDKGFKFALYQDYGNMTCMGYPGVLGYEAIDVQTFAEWDVDYIKLDGCYIDIAKMDTGYPHFGKLMNESGRPMVYSCSWPAYQKEPDYASIAKHCNLWRNWDDIQDSWSSLSTIMTWFAENQDTFAKYAGPGNWNDPDMLIIGNYGLSLDQAKVQMAIWSMLAAPLFMSVDLATIRPEFKEILLNRDIIAIDQDVLGKQGLRVWNGSRCEIWRRELSDGSYALAFVNRRDDGTPYVIKASFEAMDIPEQAYEVQDLYKEDADRTFGPDGEFSTRVNPLGVKYFKFVPKKSNEILQESQNQKKNYSVNKI